MMIGGWRRFAAGVAAMVVSIAFTGCASTSNVASAAWPQDVPEHVTLTQVPYFAQEDHQCGPAALAMAMQAAGAMVSPDAITEQVYLPGRKGSLQVDMLAAPRRHGLVSYLLQPALEDVVREVAGGRPVVLLQNVSLPVYPVWHYAVVIGYDRNNDSFTLNSGHTANLQLSRYTLEKTWERSGRWAMVVTQPYALPATATPQAWSQASAALERADPQAAELAYQSGLAAWPQNALLMFGLGNATYGLGRTLAAQQAFSKLVQWHPTHADGWNNLAQTYLDLGQKTLALQAASNALTLGGPHRESYADLLRKISSK